MKKNLLISFLFFSALILGACNGNNDDGGLGNDDEDVTEDTTNNDTDNDIEYTEHGEDPNFTPGDTFGFTGFDLQVDYKNPDDQLKVLYREKQDTTDVEYFNGATGEQRTGNEAMSFLRPILEDVSIEPDTTEDEVMKKIKEAFQITGDFTSIDATFTFLNGEKKEYNLMN